MSYPQPERGETERADFDAAATMPPAADPQQPRPVVPIVLTAEKPADKVMENMTAALPDMDADMRELAKRTLSKVDALTDEEYAGLAVYAADEA